MFSQQMRARVFLHCGENGEISIFAKRGVHWTSGQLRFSSRSSKGLKIFSITTFVEANIYTIYFISLRRSANRLFLIVHLALSFSLLLSLLLNTISIESAQ
ncbi:hypothetical protein ACS0PU_010043 [Formica fusca]